MTGPLEAESQTRSCGRREFLRTLAGLSVAPEGLATLRAGARDVLPNPVGYATIAWPREEFAHALDTISRLGYRGVQLLGWVREASGNKSAATRGTSGLFEVESRSSLLLGRTIGSGAARK